MRRLDSSKGCVLLDGLMKVLGGLLLSAHEKCLEGSMQPLPSTKTAGPAPTSSHDGIGAQVCTAGVPAA